MCNIDQAMQILREAFIACNERMMNSVCEAYLYGSFARGDYTAESDLDILMTSDLNEEQIRRYKREISKINSELSLLYDVTVSITVKSARHFEEYMNILPYYKNVKREGIRYAG